MLQSNTYMRNIVMPSPVFDAFTVTASNLVVSKQSILSLFLIRPRRSLALESSNLYGMATMW